jgi:hypothetical protein
MLDRQDIDALLMGALYGELSPSESTRLDEHLSAHPQDKLVLDGLTRARQALRDSHVLVLQAEPPAAVSALLLQEAARRAPAAREQRVGFFAKLAALLRHPATAAAAVIGLVAGVAGTLYVQGKGAALEDRAPDQSTAGLAPAAEPAAIAPTTGDSLAVSPSAGSAAPGTLGEDQGFEGNYRAGLADDEAAPEDKPTRLAKDTASNAEPAKNEAAFARDGQRAGAKEAEEAPAEDRKQKKGKGYIEVTTPDPQPKTLEDGGADEFTGLAQGGAQDPKAPPPTAPAKSPAASTRAAPRGTVDSTGAAQTAESLDFDSSIGTATAGGGGSAPTTEKADKAAAAKPTDARNDQAAKAAHAKLIALVKNNKCNDAAKAAGQLYATYPDYYAEFVANDRQIKACKAYIDSDRKRRNEALKSRSKVTNEAAPAADSSK